ncbi:M14 metallopeptidase family protein [Rohdeia mirabilis]|uniref:M14 metallopeptidase family protein n=1 Tax=Rohdeia mirabilis TaxID=2528008 RepID=UPI003AF34E09
MQLRDLRSRISSVLAAVLIASSVATTHAVAQIGAPDEGPQPLSWYLPDDVTYDAAFPVPADVLGWEIGTWHARHDQIVRWFELLAERSDRISIEVYGHSHEGKPLVLATVTSPANHARLEDLRSAHVEAVLSGAESFDGPNVVWMGYGVHGNEPSASNAALLTGYHLAAATGGDIDAFLENTIVLIDTCLNPDGHDRFAQWANSHKGVNLVGDPAHREHREVWPGGRTNHYWFDLNRDWLLLTHPESRGRIERFHAWMPQVLTDYHEMGTGASYFFQPGIPSRTNPLTPFRNVELTREIATYHAAALDDLGSLYYTEESYDDFYYGKGSTYPDAHGCIGILFEQASSRGHFQENDYGGISFPFTIKNQFTTSLSTFAAVDGMRAKLSDYQRSFYRDAAREGGESEIGGYVFGCAEDPLRARRMADLLDRHGIEVVAATDALEDESYERGASWVVPTGQPQYRLVRALFELRTSWDDNTFYDVSSWAFPLSFGVQYRALGRDELGAVQAVGEAYTEARGGGLFEGEERPVAWAFEWHRSSAARALNQLLEAGVVARVSTQAFGASTQGDMRTRFDRGTIVVPRGIQTLPTTEVRAALRDVSELGLEVRALTSGLTFEGLDLGSGNVQALEAPRPLMLVGGNVSAYEAGEVWFHLDQRVGLALSMVEQDDFRGLDLARYTHLVLVSGATSGWGDSEEEKVRDWVRAGGVVVATKSSAVWAAENLMSNADGDDDAKDEDEDGDSEPPAYADYAQLRSTERVAGTIFEARLDLTHPMCFGYTRDRLPVFRNFNSTLPESTDPFAVPLRYTDAPLLSGFAADENVERIAGTPVLRAQRVGSGTVIALVDDPLFRGVWDGTAKLFENALFFGRAIDRTGPLGEEAGE